MASASSESNGRSAFNLERRVDHEHPVEVNEAQLVVADRSSALNRRVTPGTVGQDDGTSGGRVVSVKWGDTIRRIGIDGSSEAIKDAIRSAFGLRTKRPFWLEDDEGIVRSIDRDMPLKNYTLHLDEGLTIRICIYEGPNEMPIHAEEKTFYVEDDFCEFLQRRGWVALKDLRCYRNVESIGDLHPGEMYHGLSR